MDWEDVRPKKDGVVVGEPLDRFSVDDLVARIETLKAEIERAEVELDRKKRYEAQAAAVFKS